MYVTTAHAYIDPGSQPLMLQAILAMVGGLLLSMKRPTEIVKTLVRRLRNRNSA